MISIFKEVGETKFSKANDRIFERYFYILLSAKKKDWLQNQVHACCSY